MTSMIALLAGIAAMVVQMAISRTREYAADLEDIEKRCVQWRWRINPRQERLCQVHGDFHPWNLMFREGADFSVLDRSRGEWGEAADDVTCLALNYFFFSLQRSGRLEGAFEKLWRRFWERYLERSGDAALLEVAAPFIAFRGLVMANPLWYPALDESLRFHRRQQRRGFHRNAVMADIRRLARHRRRVEHRAVERGEGVGVLLDELGSATDPEEGAALAVAMVLLIESFGRDVWWLWRHRRRESAEASSEGTGTVPFYGNHQAGIDTAALAPIVLLLGVAAFYEDELAVAERRATRLGHLHRLDRHARAVPDDLFGQGGGDLGGDAARFPEAQARRRRPRVRRSHRPGAHGTGRRPGMVTAQPPVRSRSLVQASIWKTARIPTPS